jgi:hypothetical protein
MFKKFINLELLDDAKYEAEKARVAAAAQAKRQQHNETAKAVVRTANLAVVKPLTSYVK